MQIKLKLFPLFLVSIIGCVFAFGCSTAQSTAYKTILTSQTSAEAALRGWNVYVGQYHPTTNTEYIVKTCYDVYRNAELVALTATQLWISDTNNITNYTAMVTAQQAQTIAQTTLLTAIATNTVTSK